MSVYIKGFLIACQGIPTTVWVSLIAIVIGAAFGLLLALCSQTRSKILQVLAKIYVDVVRGTPMLVQALIMAYGVPWLLQSWGTGFKWANLVIPAIIVCGCNSAAYMSEIIRSGIQAVDKGQMEAARSLGMSHGMAMKLIIIPQAIRVILPAFANEFVTLIKETSVLGYVGVIEILRRGQLWNASSFETFPAYIGVALAYMLLTIPLSKIINGYERKMARRESAR
ncbi:MAG: amino acid ABC transporter permease [Mogibacterium sp.]|nr:amino acid ABC transporter permease [Mogibacterium sp.]MBR0379770.1 amino acid ABC transporter permease [Mogibacterium sp.]